MPQLIQNGNVEHSYLGISGTNLTPDLAQAMGLDANQRGALVGEVASGGPAEKAGLRGSTDSVTVDGQEGMVGGDVITAIDSQSISGIDDLIAYLTEQTSVGQKVVLEVLRDGKTQSIEVTLEARPKSGPA